MLYCQFIMFVLCLAEEAIQNGILVTYESNVACADVNLLTNKNFTNVPSQDVIKTAVKEAKQDGYLDTNLITEIEMLMGGIKAADTSLNLNNAQSTKQKKLDDKYKGHIICFYFHLIFIMFV